MRGLLAVLLGLLVTEAVPAEQAADTNAPAIAEPAKAKPPKRKRKKKAKKKPINWSEWENVR